MKNIIRYRGKFLIAFLGFAITFGSCEYETDVRSATYPDQLIYMPASYDGNFVINDISRKRGDLPFDGNLYRYIIDTIGKTFTVPLGVYRSGINNNGAFKVDIAVNTDTINKLLLIANKLPAGTILLGSDKYSIVSSLDMPDGEEFAPFDLVINLDSLRNNYPNKIYALGVGISSTQRKTNPKLSTTIVVIYTNIMKSTAGFTYSPDQTNSKLINFSNTSLMGVSYSWDFGDGSARSTITAPTHIYAAAGAYTVTLLAKGISFYSDRSTRTTVITVL